MYRNIQHNPIGSVIYWWWLYAGTLGIFEVSFFKRITKYAKAELRQESIGIELEPAPQDSWPHPKMGTPLAKSFLAYSILLSVIWRFPIKSCTGTLDCKLSFHFSQILNQFPERWMINWWCYFHIWNGSLALTVVALTGNEANKNNCNEKTRSHNPASLK